MRKYTLADSEARTKVDLRDYEDVIIKAVREAMAEATVTVERDCYIVAPAPDRGTAIRVGRQICKSGLSKHCIQIPKLFSSVQIQDDVKEECHEGTKQQSTGGHLRDH